MRDITREMLTFRECARTVWNVYFRELAEGWHEFIPVERELFRSLVVAQVFETHSISRPELDVWVVPDLGPRGVKVLWAIQRENEYAWTELNLQDRSIRLRFREFFDWSDTGYRDMSLVRCQVLESADDRLAEAELLLDIRFSKFEANAAP